MNFPFYIAGRYLRSKSTNNAINIINRISSVGIVVGSMALFVVLSVFSGLRDFSLSFSNDFDPDLKVGPKSGKSFLVSTDQEQKLHQIQGIDHQTKIIEERVLFVFDGKEQVAYLKGVDSIFSKVNDITKIIYQGDWLEPNTSQVVIGNGTSQKLSLGLMDFNHPFEVYVPKPGTGTIERPEDAFNQFTLAPVGIYALSEELDDKFVFCELRLAQALLEFKTNQISGIEIKLKPGVDEQTVRASLAKIFPDQIEVKNRAQLNDSLYKMLNTENVAIYLIFTLVIILVLFAFSGSIFMVIIDKQQNLKTLYNLGAEMADLRRIFLLQGTLVCVIGGLFGLLLGSIIVLVQQQFQLIMITPSLAYPVVYSWQNVLVVFATIVSLGFIASWIASSRVSKKLME
ncbi:ABC transporter permease [Flavobacterium caeni]|uniref:Lipoprotein-releasing system permease protein n=1 Tax=Flavobacterium caeni TaxID=490189 RepID=A0A1G5H764_9FLAO|nr:FtsX-like permease family protein [Flavobacterium caeni]SCY59616.1 lipoprotein-releasing system permease protein [Flavobacterium caeni]